MNQPVQDMDKIQESDAEHKQQKYKVKIIFPNNFEIEISLKNPPIQHKGQQQIEHQGVQQAYEQYQQATKARESIILSTVQIFQHLQNIGLIKEEHISMQTSYVPGLWMGLGLYWYHHYVAMLQSNQINLQQMLKGTYKPLNIKPVAQIMYDQQNQDNNIFLVLTKCNWEQICQKCSQIYGQVQQQQRLQCSIKEMNQQNKQKQILYQKWKKDQIQYPLIKKYLSDQQDTLSDSDSKNKQKQYDAQIEKVQNHQGSQHNEKSQQKQKQLEQKQVQKPLQKPVQQPEQNPAKFRRRPLPSRNYLRSGYKKPAFEPKNEEQQKFPEFIQQSRIKKKYIITFKLGNRIIDRKQVNQVGTINIANIKQKYEVYSDQALTIKIKSKSITVYTEHMCYYCKIKVKQQKNPATKIYKQTSIKELNLQNLQRNKKVKAMREVIEKDRSDSEDYHMQYLPASQTKIEPTNKSQMFRSTFRQSRTILKLTNQKQKQKQKQHQQQQQQQQRIYPQTDKILKKDSLSYRPRHIKRTFNSTQIMKQRLQKQNKTEQLQQEQLQQKKQKRRDPRIYQDDMDQSQLQ